MKILNLYAGIGGNRKLWSKKHNITAVEFNEKIAKIYKKNFPQDKVIIADAHKFLLDNYENYDFIWSSPPCPTHSRVRLSGIYDKNSSCRPVYPDMTLYQEILLLKSFAKGFFCIENVIPYYLPLIPPDKKLHRHLYWANFPIGDFKTTQDRKHTDIKSDSTVYGFNIKEEKVENKVKVLRNMVDPDLGNYILNRALGYTPPSKKDQLVIF